MERKQAVGILGTGWLGEALVESLVTQGYRVHGSYRRAENHEAIVANGGHPFCLDLPEGSEELTAFLEGTDTLVITLPPRGRSLGDLATERYLAALRSLAGRLDDRHVIYTSSTGVYGSKATGGVEEDRPVAPDTPSAMAVVAAEEWLIKNAGALTVLRLAGLIGPDRDPAKFFSKRSTVAGGDAAVNLVHRKDVITAIELVLSIRPKGIFNVCALTHPTKRVFYGQLISRAGMPEVEFLAGGGDGKVIDSTRIRQLGWSPEYDNLTL